MKNTLTINTNGKFEVECVDMVDSGNNSIILNVITGENPESLHIYVNDVLITIFSDLIPASENPFVIPDGCHVADSLLKIQYGSESFLLFSFPSSIIGNMTVEKVEDLSYSVKYSYSNDNLMLQCYPIGSIYMSINNINPSLLFGGVWEEWGKGKTIIGVDARDTDFNVAEKTGGEKTHKLSVEELPSHNHLHYANNAGKVPIVANDVDLTSFSVTSSSSGNRYALGGVSGTESAFSVAERNTTIDTGGGEVHNNLQPYITCYMWKRTA